MVTRSEVINRLKVFICFFVGHIGISLLWPVIGRKSISEQLFLSGVSALAFCLIWPAMLRFVYRLTEKLAGK